MPKIRGKMLDLIIYDMGNPINSYHLPEVKSSILFWAKESGLLTNKDVVETLLLIFISTSNRSSVSGKPSFLVEEQDSALETKIDPIRKNKANLDMFVDVGKRTKSVISNT